MILTEPLRLTETDEVYDVDATIDGGGVTGQAGALRLGIARALVELDAELRAVAEEGRLPHPRRPREGVQEVRPEEGPQGSAVLQALSQQSLARVIALRFGTDGVRGVANTELTPELVVALGRAAAARASAPTGSRRPRHPRSRARCSRPRSPPASPPRARRSCDIGVAADAGGRLGCRGARASPGR